MKIKRIADYNMALHLTFACSRCEAEVDKGDRFCYNCGHKLSALPDEIKMQKAADILTNALRKGAEK